MEIVAASCHVIIPIYRLILPVLRALELFCALVIFPILNAITFGGLYSDRPLCDPDNYGSAFTEFSCADLVYWSQITMREGYEPQCGLHWSPHYLYCRTESPSLWQTSRETLEIVIINTTIILYFSSVFRDMVIEMRRNRDTPGLD